MNTFVWGTITNGFGLSGDWNTASLWAGGIVPDAADAAVLIGAAGSYSVTIAAGEMDIVNTLTLTGSARNLTVNGTLEFAGPLPPSTYTGTIPMIIGASGEIEGVGLFSAGGLLNNGTIDANAGSDVFLEILNTVTNNGVLLADNGDLFVSGLANLQNGTLTGGIYSARGFIPADVSSYALNSLQIGQGSGPGIVTDAATIILDGAASVIEVLGTGNTAQTLEQQLGSVAPSGTLMLLDGYDYLTGNSLTDAGLIVLGGGTLSTAGLTVSTGARLSGYGDIIGGLVNDGTIVINGGSLGTALFGSAMTGNGALSVAAGSELVMAGATVATLADNGVIYDSGAISVTGSLSGSGTILVEQGALEFANASSVTVAFAGSGVTIALDSPLQFQGVVAGFETDDTLLLSGISATSATIVNGNTLALIASGATLDTVTLTGDYANASFQAVAVNGTTSVTNLSGAPARDGIGIETIAVTNTIGLSGSLIAAIENDLSFAVAEWGQYITGVAPLRISLSFVDSGNFGGELALGSPGGFIPTGQTIDGHPIYIPDSLYALQTGNYVSGFASDIAITLVASATNLANFYINPDPSAGTTVPLGEIDLTTVLQHEIGHGLGFIGLINQYTPQVGSPPIVAGAAADTYDMLVSYGTTGSTATATFGGTNAEAVYGAMINAGSSVSVPLYQATDPSLIGENFYHLASIAALSGDLMNVAIASGTFLPISNLDLAILQDTGVPVTSYVTCFVRGTRIRTPDGDTPIESLQVNDRVLTRDGSVRPIIWIGRRTIDCARHPDPDRVRPVRIAAHVFGEGLPERPLRVSPNHALYLDNILIPARFLIDGVRITRELCSTVEYFHLELASHDIVFAEGLPSETYLDCGDRRDFSNGLEPVRLFPDMAASPPGDAWESRGCAPLCLGGAPVAAVRARIARSPHQLPVSDSPADVEMKRISL